MNFSDLKKTFKNLVSRTFFQALTLLYRWLAVMTDMFARQVRFLSALLSSVS